MSDEQLQQAAMTYAPSHQPVHPMLTQNEVANKELAMLTIQNQDLLDSLELFMSGMELRNVFNNKTGENETKAVKVSAPVVNKAGRSSIINFVRMHIHRNTILSSAREENEIKMLLTETHITITKEILNNSAKELYDVDLKKVEALAWAIMNAIRSAMNRGYNRGEGELLYGGRKEIYQHHSDDYSKHLLARTKGSFLQGM